MKVRRIVEAARAHVGLLAVLATAAGCPADAADVRPPADAFYFPTGLATTPEEEDLFVINANADLRFASGDVVTVDLDKVVSAAEAWIQDGDIGADCERNASLPFLIDCEEERFLRADSSVRLASFATEIGVQALNDGRSRLFVAARGDPSITYIDYDPDDHSLSCGGSGSQPQCNTSHRLSSVRGDLEVGRLVEEPFELYVDSAQEFVAVSHLTSGSVTLVDAPSSGARPVISDVISGLFAADPVTGAIGAVGIAGRRPGAPLDLLYVTSRSDSRVQLLSVVRPAVDRLPHLAPADFFFLAQVNPSDDSRDIVFSDDGNRAYIVNRDPPLLHIIDTSDGPDGKPINRFVGGVEVCAEASNVTLMDAGRGDRVYVSCFQNGQVWVIDPVGRVVESIIDVGRGPNSIVGLPDRGLLLVSNYLEDTISVIDVAPGSRLENRFVMRIGLARQSEGQ